MNRKDLLVKLYKIINFLPFNNKKHGKVNIYNEGSILIKCKIYGNGTRNILKLRRGGVYRHCEFIFLGNNNVIEFGEDCRATSGSFYIEDSNNKIVTGNNTNYAGKIHIACTEGKQICIGDNCLFSSEIVIRNGDSHSVIDMNGKRINQAKDVIIKNHVWVGLRALITKGAMISDNSIVGTGSVVTKQFQDTNVAIAGVPAKIIKENVDWRAERI
jgi:acetyltransferase-like isoleucine patch superfamily enzyme